MARFRKILAASALLATLFSLPAAALSYDGYIYDGWQQPVPSQIGYEPVRTVTAKDFGTGVLDMYEPQAMAVAGDSIYVLDTGNDRLLILDTDFKLQAELTQFLWKGEPTTLNAPEGVFVSKEGLLYIADTGNERILVCDRAGNVQLEILRPDSRLLDETVEFKPRKVLADSNGNIYATMTGVYQGMLLFGPAGEFEGFFGSNTVELSASLLLDRFWKQLLSDEHQENISNYVPEEITNFAIDSKDFIYTVTQTQTVQKKLKKLNPAGDNILDSEDFGELETIWINRTPTASRFVDVAVDEAGNINVLDQQNNRIFQYDAEGQQLFIFGGKGYQEGTFMSPSAMACLGSRVLVLDSQKANITVFAPTAFGEAVHEAVGYFNDGRYEESEELWRDILRLDHNYELAYISIGKALLAQGRYQEAAESFQLGHDREGNSEAFEALRNQAVHAWFPVICLGILVLLGLLVWWASSRRKKKKEPKPRRRMSPFAFLAHPIECAEEMKLKKSGSLAYAVLVLLVWMAVTFASYSLTGFRFNQNDPDQMNVFFLFLGTIPLFAVWVTANWGVSTLADGKGRYKEIFIGSAYALIPYIGASVLAIALSHMLTISEGVYITWVMAAGYIWSGVVMLGVLSGLHEYTFTKTVGSTLLTILGVLVVTFLVFLVFSLIQQAVMFVYSIVNEMLYRY